MAFGICTSDRLGLITNLTKSMYGNDVKSALTLTPSRKQIGFPKLQALLTEEGYPVRNHITQQTHVLNADYFAQFVIVMIADFMEQGALVGGGDDMDVCMFQFLRFHFYNDLIQFVKPFLRVVPPVWDKYMGSKSFEEPSRQEIISFKAIWVSAMKASEEFSSHPHLLVTEKEEVLLADLVAKYPYIPEPHITLAYTIRSYKSQQVSITYNFVNILSRRRTGGRN